MGKILTPEKKPTRAPLPLKLTFAKQMAAAQRELEEKRRALPDTAPAPRTPDSPEIIALKVVNEKARESYFFNKKILPETKSPHYDSSKARLTEKENTYRDTKKAIIEKFKAEGPEGKIKAQEFLLGEVELKIKNDLENLSLGKQDWERIKSGVSKGIEWFENVGNDPKDSKTIRFWKKTTKTLASIALISGASVGTVFVASTVGGTALATTISGSVVSFVLQRAIVATAFSTATSKLVGLLPPKGQKVASNILTPAILGFSYLHNMTWGGGTMLAAGATGYAAGRGANWYGQKREKETGEKKEALMAKDIDLDKLDELEKGLEEILEQQRKAKNRTRKLTVGASLLAGFLSLEGMSYAQNHFHTETTTNPSHTQSKGHDTELKSETPAVAQAETPPPQAQNTTPEPPIAPHTQTPETGTSHVDTTHDATPDTTHPPIETPAQHLPETIAVGHGEGGIQQVLNLKEHIREHYHGDYSHAPKDIQELMKSNNNAIEYAEKWGLYKPDVMDGNESALLREGSEFKIDYANGNISFHDTATGHESVLLHGDGATGQYDGKMFHSDHSATPNTETNENSFAKPYPTPEEHQREMFSKINFGETHLGSTTPAENTTPTEGVTNQELIDALTKQGFHGDPNDRATVVKFFQDKAEAVAKENVLEQYTKVSASSVSAPGHIDIHGENNNLPHQANIPEEFVRDNPFHLANTDLRHAYESFEKSLDRIYHGDIKAWYKVYDTKIENFLGEQGRDHAVGYGYDSATPLGHLSIYLQKLYEITGLKPHGGFLGLRPETTGEWMMRASQKAASMGNLDKVNNILEK